MGAPRSRPRPPNRRTRPRPQISRRRRPPRQLLSIEPLIMMTPIRLFLALTLAATLGAQTFIQMSDPQFGMYTKDQDFAHETANFELAIATANRLHPAFIVITGDLINKAADPAQAAEFHRIAAKLDPKIKLYNAPGNHDVGNEPTTASLAQYREHFGRDYYSFTSRSEERRVGKERRSR